MTSVLAQVLETRMVQRSKLARRVGISLSLLTKMAGGQRRGSDEVRQRIADALDLPVEALFPAREEEAA